jgi:hypothetical protein
LAVAVVVLGTMPQLPFLLVTVVALMDLQLILWKIMEQERQGLRFTDLVQAGLVVMQELLMVVGQFLIL